MQIKDINILQYFQLEDTSSYDVFLDILKPENKFCGRSCNLSKITYNEFKVAVSIFNNPNAQDLKELFIMLFKIKGDINTRESDLFYNESVFTFFKARKFLHNFLEESLKLEEKVLYSEPDIKMISIKANETLAPFNTLLSKMKIGSQFGVDPEEIGNWKYKKVLNILAANNAVNTVNKRYHEQK